MYFYENKIKNKLDKKNIIECICTINIADIAVYTRLTYLIFIH
jgi:hypothetical protein